MTAPKLDTRRETDIIVHEGRNYRLEVRVTSEISRQRESQGIVKGGPMGGMEMLGQARERALAQVYEIHLKQKKSETTLLLTQGQAVKLMSMLHRVQQDPYGHGVIGMPPVGIDAAFESDDDDGTPPLS